ncbi:MAG: hypothetical protein WCI18_14140, partial [Pseudomonadota bacterium]
PFSKNWGSLLRRILRKLGIKVTAQYYFRKKELCACVVSGKFLNFPLNICPVPFHKVYTNCMQTFASGRVALAKAVELGAE